MKNSHNDQEADNNLFLKKMQFEKNKSQTTKQNPAKKLQSILNENWHRSKIFFSAFGKQWLWILNLGH